MKPPLVSLKLAVRKCQSYDLAKTRVIPLVKLEHRSYPIKRDDEMVKRIVKSWETLSLAGTQNWLLPAIQAVVKSRQSLAQVISAAPCERIL